MLISKGRVVAGARPIFLSIPLIMRLLLLDQLPWSRPLRPHPDRGRNGENSAAQPAG
jgi:hypothetical protein